MSDQDILAALADLFQLRQQVTPNFLARRNVVGCGVGYKIKGDQMTTTPSVVVSVTKKIAASALSASDLIPTQVNGALTDVIETGEIIAHGFARNAATRPLRPGVSIGLANGSTGTLGAFVRKGGLIYALSNNHVLAMLNQAAPGSAIVQPGAADGGTLAQQVATLAEYVPISLLEEAVATAAAASQSTGPTGFAAILAALLEFLGSLFSPRTSTPPPPPPMPQGNRVDAALALPIAGIGVDPNIVDLGSPPAGIIEPQLGMKVFKSGRTTGVTEAIITQLDVTVNVRYGNQSARFAGQIMTTPFSQPGDSGSLALDFQRNAVGLLFSGSTQVSVLNPISQVLAAFGAELITAPLSGSPGADFG